MKEDSCFPGMPNFINRSFEFDRELKEERVRKLLTDFIGNPYLFHCAKYLKQILKRELCSFDIIFNQFDIINHHTTHKYDELVVKNTRS